MMRPGRPGVFPSPGGPSLFAEAAGAFRGRGTPPAPIRMTFRGTIPPPVPHAADAVGRRPSLPLPSLSRNIDSMAGRLRNRPCPPSRARLRWIWKKLLTPCQSSGRRKLLTLCQHVEYGKGRGSQPCAPSPGIVHIVTKDVRHETGNDEGRRAGRAEED